jgi:hypothetical protein
MEIIMNNTIPVLGFQFNVTGADLSGASGGSAADAGFQVSTGVDGMVLGFSMLGAEIPQGNGVLTNVAYTATFNEACITNDILALGEWSGGFYEINIGGCAALDYGVETTTLDVTYSSDTDIYGFQFDVSGAELVNASGGDAETTFDQISFSSETGMVLGLSFIGASIPAGSGILLELEVVGDGTGVCITDLVLSGAGGADMPDASDKTRSAIKHKSRHLQLQVLKVYLNLLEWKHQ